MLCEVDAVVWITDEDRLDMLSVYLDHVTNTERTAFKVRSHVTFAILSKFYVNLCIKG